MGILLATGGVSHSNHCLSTIGSRTAWLILFDIRVGLRAPIAYLHMNDKIHKYFRYHVFQIFVSCTTYGMVSRVKIVHEVYLSPPDEASAPASLSNRSR